jgi:outer membrane biosynthesis protein TonB
LAGLRPSSPKVRLDALTIAVVVNPDGSVDSVHGLVAPENISEVLLLTEALSAVKSWRFSPATRDGAPVKYRQVVPIGTLSRATP